VKVTMPTVEIFALSEEVPVKVQPPVPELNMVTTLPPLPLLPPLALPSVAPVLPVPPEPPDLALAPQPSPTQNRDPQQTRAVESLFFIVGAAAYGRVSPSSTSPSTETRSTSARSGATETRAYPESGQYCT
jgi:hypothetical protein